MSTRYLSLKEVAEQIGVAQSTISTHRLPEPDAMIRRTLGWYRRLERVPTWTRQLGRGEGTEE